MAWDRLLIAEPEGPSFISRTVAHRLILTAALVTHDPERKWQRHSTLGYFSPAAFEKESRSSSGWSMATGSRPLGYLP